MQWLSDNAEWLLIALNAVYTAYVQATKQKKRS